jgi:hypothetical protein
LCQPVTPIGRTAHAVDALLVEHLNEAGEAFSLNLLANFEA